MCILCGFAILFHFSWIFLLILSVFYAFSAAKFMLILNIASLLTVGVITVFPPVVSSYKEYFAVVAGYNDAFRKEIFPTDVFRLEACDEILPQLYDCYME